MISLFLALTFCALAQQPAPAAERSAAPDTTAAEPATPTPPAAPAEPAPSVESPTPAAAAPAVEAGPAEPPLRRIDEPDTSTPAPSRGKSRRSTRGGSGDFPFGNHTIAKGSETRDAVSIFGSTTVEGEVTGDAVSILGKTRIGPDASVSGAAVAVLGKLDVGGKVGQEAVSVLGGVNIDGEVHGEVVSVLGNIRLGPKAVVNGDIVVVGGKLTKEPGAVVRGNEVNVPAFGAIGDLEWLTTWFKRCLLLGRPLAFGPHLGWAWLVALSFLALYLLLALLFPRGVDRCAETLENRPGYTILASMLTVLLTPVVIVLLVFTVVGAVLVPFLLVGLMFAGLFGKAVMLAWLGRRVARVFNSEVMAHAVTAVFVGGVIVLALYVVPVLGFLVFKLLGWLGVGVVVYTVALRMKREKPPTPPPAPVIPGLPVAPPSPDAPAAAAMSATAMPPSDFAGNPEPGAASSGFAAMPPIMGGIPMAPPPTTTLPTATLPAASALALPRATFMIRMAALVLDIILVAVIVSFLTSMLPRPLRFGGGPGILPLLALYGAIMWKMKATTIGGIICGLKVVRLDGREMDWPTAIVRALGCFLSLIVVGLGFIWIAIDDEKQSWHDKIAGTIVVRLPKGMSLL